MDKGHVLIVDDVGFNRILLERGLTSAGYRVDQAGGGHDALRLLSKGRFDLVITDLMMPDMDGLQLLDRVKESRFADDSGPIPTPPFILCTAHAHEEIRSQAAEHGFWEVLSKPIEREKLLAATEKAIKRVADPIDLTLDLFSSSTLESLQQRLTARPEEIARVLLTVLSGVDFPETVRSLSSFETHLATALGVDLGEIQKRREALLAEPSEESVKPEESLALREGDPKAETEG